MPRTLLPTCQDGHAGVTPARPDKSGAGGLALGDEGRPLQVRPPARMHATGAEHPPRGTGRSAWRAPKPPTQLDQRAVGLRVVAAAAARDDVLPDVLTTAAARHDMVDARRGRGAVDAATAVAGEDGATGERNVHAVRHPDEPVESHHDRHTHHQVLAVHLAVTALHGHRLAGEHEDDGASGRHDAQGLVRRVQHQRVSHPASLRSLSPIGAVLARTLTAYLRTERATMDT